MTSELKNDWEDDDDWEDWNDAEDVPSLKPNEMEKNKVQPSRVAIKSEEEENTATEKSAATTTTTPTGKSSWGNVWKPWEGVMTTVLSTASESIGNITNTVSQGLDKVIGVPDPEELARKNAAEQAAATPADTTNSSKQAAPNVNNDAQAAFGLNLVSGVTTLGSKVLNSGLDTLEGIGKRTMNILQENDPGLKNKRKLLGFETERPNLSEVLKEAKQDAEQIENTLKELKLEKSKELLNFEHIFENNCGLVHLEALEILSKESNLKLQTLLDSVSGNALQELRETINEVKELLELEDLESGESDGEYDAQQLNERLTAAVEDVQLNISFDDISNNWSDTLSWLATAAEEAEGSEIFAKGITALAVTCALQMNKLHKIAELLLVKEHHSTANEVDGIVQLCKEFNMHLTGLSNRYAAALSAKECKAQANSLFAEMLLALQQIEKAFKLFLPILQIGAV